MEATLMSIDRWMDKEVVLLYTTEYYSAIERNTFESVMMRWMNLSSVQSLSHVWLCNPMNCSMPGLPVHHQLSESTQTHVHWVGDAIQPSHPLSSPSPAPSPSQHQPPFQMGQLYASGGQSIRVSASTSVLPKNTQDWSPLRWAGWIHPGPICYWR